MGIKLLRTDVYGSEERRSPLPRSGLVKRVGCHFEKDPSGLLRLSAIDNQSPTRLTRLGLVAEGLPSPMHSRLGREAVKIGSRASDITRKGLTVHSSMARHAAFQAARSHGNFRRKSFSKASRPARRRTTKWKSGRGCSLANSFSCRRNNLICSFQVGNWSYSSASLPAQFSPAAAS